MKKTLALVLALILVMSVMPLAIFAADPIEISTAEGFAAIKDNLAGSYKLTADITLDSVDKALSYKAESSKFTGTFDGDGHTITIDFNDTSSARTGIFCSVEGCTIKNLVIRGTAKSNGGNSLGALIGTVKGSATVTIDNVHNYANLTDSGDERKGNFIGCIEDGGVTVNFSNCINEGIGKGGFVGRFMNNGTVNFTDCENKGAMTGAFAGGFVSYAQGNGTINFLKSIIGCINNGAISGDVTGGFIGRMNSTTVNITDAVNNGSVNCTNQYADYRGAGGFVGSINEDGGKLTLTNCTNSGNINAKYIAANAYVGTNNANTTLNVNNCTNTGTVTCGEFTLPAALATAKVRGIFSEAGSFSFSYSAYHGSTFKGNPKFHEVPSLTGFKAYLNGVDVTANTTLTDPSDDKKVNIVVNDARPTNAGYVCLTIVFADGTYSSFACNCSLSLDELVKAEALFFDTSSFIKTKLTYTSATGRLMKDGHTEVHGSEANLFDTDNGNKYEGWKKNGTDIVIDFEAAEALKVGVYTIQTANDDDRSEHNGRQPRAWKLYGSADGETYVEIDSVTDFDMPNVSNTDIAFVVNCNTSYKYYRISFIQINGEVGNSEEWHYTQIGAIGLYELQEVSETLSPNDGDNYKFFYQTRGNSDNTTDYRIIGVAGETYINSREDYGVTITFKNIDDATDTKSITVTLATVYSTVDAFHNGKADHYSAADSNLIFGWVVLDVPNGYTIDSAVWAA